MEGNPHVDINKEQKIDYYYYVLLIYIMGMRLIHWLK